MCVQAGEEYNRSDFCHAASNRKFNEFKCGYEFNVNLNILFIDFRQALDSINRGRLYEALVKQGIRSKLVRLIKITLTDTKAAVMIGSLKGATLNVRTGVRQGDALSEILYSIDLNYAVERLNLNGSIIYRLKQVCAYADDIALVARNMNALTEMFLDLERECRKSGLNEC